MFGLIVRRRLATLNDPREVVADPHAKYSGAEIDGRTLVPGKDAQLGETRFETWLTQPAAKVAAVPTVRLSPAALTNS